MYTFTEKSYLKKGIDLYRQLEDDDDPTSKEEITKYNLLLQKSIMYLQLSGDADILKANLDKL